MHALKNELMRHRGAEVKVPKDLRAAGVTGTHPSKLPAWIIYLQIANRKS